MLKSIRIDNYRSCVHTSLEFQPQLSVLIGPNGSGKTNILQSVLLLNKLTSSADVSLAKLEKESNSQVRAVFETSGITASFKASFDATTNDLRSSRHRWMLRNKKGKQAELYFPPVYLDKLVGRGMGMRSYPFGHLSANNRIRLMLRDDSPKWAGAALSTVWDFCRGIKYYSASQFTNPNSCPVSFEVEAEGPQRFARSQGHTRLLYNMYAAMQGDGKAFQNFIHIVGPSGMGLINKLTFKTVHTSSTNYSVRVGGKVETRKKTKLLVIPQFKVGRLSLSPNQLSEGTFKTLALVFHIMTDDSRAVLIEEPEVCVHHGLLSSILDLIKSYSARKQMIISTHSDYVLDRVAPEDVYAVSFKPSSGTAVRHIPEAITSSEFAALREYLRTEGNLGEYWREGGLSGIS